MFVYTFSSEAELEAVNENQLGEHFVKNYYFTNIEVTLSLCQHFAVYLGELGVGVGKCEISDSLCLREKHFA